MPGPVHGAVSTCIAGLLMAASLRGAGDPAPKFSHKQHAALELECALCHTTAGKQPRAGFPKVASCMLCHSAVRQESAAIKRLAAMDRQAALAPGVRAYRVADFVFFSHARHRAAGLECASCHGDVWQFDSARPAVEPKMSGCVNCHKAAGAKVDCVVCHELSQ